MSDEWTRRERPEWIGKTPDSKVPPHVQLRVFERHGGRCHIAKRKILGGEPWDCDHVIALRDWTGEGHGNRESNLAPALKDKHRDKTAAENRERAPITQKRMSHVGIKRAKRKIPSHVNPWGYRP